MLKMHSGLVAAAITVLILASSAALGDEPSTSKDLKTYTCKDAMRLSGEERVIALALLHGYNLGKKNTTQFNTEAMARVTDSFIDYCLDHPAEKALESFEKVSK
jgi:hypothetical protein